MRLFIFYDLPTFTAEERKAGNSFRKRLLKEGFLMLQESVYCKLVLNDSALQLLKEKVKKFKPNGGSIISLAITEKQYERMEFLIDGKSSKTLDTTDKLVIL